MVTCTLCFHVFITRIPPSAIDRITDLYLVYSRLATTEPTSEPPVVEDVSPPSPPELVPSPEPEFELAPESPPKETKALVEPVKEVEDVKPADSVLEDKPVHTKDTPVSEHKDELPLATEAVKPEEPVDSGAAAAEPQPPLAMEESEEPIPVPKGSYAIDWDNFDENINPFETKTKVVMGSSPPIRSNPTPVDFTDHELDPFKSSSKMMANTPPGSPKNARRETVPPVSDENENIKPTENGESTADSQPTEQANENKENQEKKPPPRKSPKYVKTSPNTL